MLHGDITQKPSNQRISYTTGILETGKKHTLYGKLCEGHKYNVNVMISGYATVFQTGHKLNNIVEIQSGIYWEVRKV